MRKKTAWVLASVVLGFGLRANADWNTFQNDPSHDGYVPGSLSTSTPTVLWSTTLPSGSLTSMAVGGGDVYVSSSVYEGSSTAPSFFALNVGNGAVSWQYSMGTTYAVDPPAYMNGVVYVQESGGPNGQLFYGFNASKGTTIFQTVYSTQAASFLAPTIVNGIAYTVGGYDGGMYAFNVPSGSIKWLGSVPQYYGWTPSVANGLCYVYTGSSLSNAQGTFTILNASTGATVSKTTDNNFDFSETGYYMNEAPALGSANDAFVTNNGRLLKFSTNASGGLLATATDTYSGQPSVAHGDVFLVDGDLTELAAVSESTLNQLWLWSPPDGQLLNRDNIVTDNTVIVSTRADVYGISLSGQTLWSEPVTGNLALSGNVLYVSSGSTVTAFAVPEPAMGTFLIAAAATLSRRRRRGRVLTSRDIFPTASAS